MITKFVKPRNLESILAAMLGINKKLIYMKRNGKVAHGGELKLIFA